MIVTQAPSRRLEGLNDTLRKRHLNRIPVHVSANTDAALDTYCKALMMTISHFPSSMDDNAVLASLAFNLNQKQNRALPRFISRTFDSTAALRQCLEKANE